VPRLDCALTRLALIAALAAAVGLAGCGRKGPLERPPSASIAAPPAANGKPTKTANGGFDADGKPIAATGKQKHIFLDWLLN